MSCGNDQGRAVRRVVAWLFVGLGWLGFLHSEAQAGELVLEPKMRHLRNAEPREWTEFPEVAEAKELTYSFEVTDTFRPQTLVLRHRDLRRDWLLSLDGQVLIRLAQGDQDATTFWPLAPERFQPGKHELKISCKDKAADDVMIGELRLDTRTKAEMLGEATVDVEVRAVKPTGQLTNPLPCRLTIVDERGSLMTVGIEPSVLTAVRPGVIYPIEGRAKFTVPAGKYVLYASHGFEYSVVETKLDLQVGDVETVRPIIKHEVVLDELNGFDMHVHTLTHSGHGDCTEEERIATILGEGVVAITTEHNKITDYSAAGKRLGLPQVSIAGTELTTKIGHFNVWPLPTGAAPIEHEVKDWNEVDAAIHKVVADAIIILNHGRDIHNGFRPFGPERHISIAGEDVAGWKFPGIAMEVFNSGSTQNDPTQLFHDWLGLLNRGYLVVPIGSSDSHDVSRYIVGQGRTYMSKKPAWTIGAAMGLFCSLQVNGAGYRDIVPPADEYRVSVEVHGPSWVSVDQVRLFVDGSETSIKPVGGPPESRFVGAKPKRTLVWTLPAQKRDMHVVALAQGPGVDKPFGPMAKPYQPTSPDWKSYVIGCSSATLIDCDGDGDHSSPYDYAKRLVRRAGKDDAKLVAALADCNEATAVQAASVARAKGRERFDAFLAAVEKDGAPQTKSGVRKYVEGWRATLVGAASDK